MLMPMPCIYDPCFAISPVDTGHGVNRQAILSDPIMAYQIRFLIHFGSSDPLLIPP